MKTIFKIIFIPFVFSLISCFIFTKFFVLLTFLSIFWIVANRREFHHYESLGAFFITGGCMIPINFKFINEYIPIDMIWKTSELLEQINLITLIILFYIFLFSIEELLVVFIAVKLFKQKHKIIMK